MLYREIIAVCSQIHTKHLNTPCGQIFIRFSNALRNVLQFITAPCSIVTLRYAEHDGHAQHNTTTTPITTHAQSTVCYTPEQDTRGLPVVLSIRVSHFSPVLSVTCLHRPDTCVTRRTGYICCCYDAGVCSLYSLNFDCSPKMQRGAKFYARVVTWRHLTHC